MATQTANRKSELLKELETIQKEEQRKEIDKELQKNYEEWKERPSLFLLGKAYCQPNRTRYSNTSTGFQRLGISIHVPGNCGTTYEVTKQVPSAVVTYFHNVFTNKMRQELQQDLNKLVEKTIAKALDTPEFILEMLGLQSDSYYLRSTEHYPKQKIAEIEAEIQKERFNVLDKFTEAQLLKVKDLSHSRGILAAYAKDRKLKKLIKHLSLNN